MSEVQLGDWVVIRVNEGAKFIITEVVESATVRVLKKKQFKAVSLVGYKYGDYFELDKKGNISIWDRSKNIQVTKINEDEYESIGDNRNVKRNDPTVQSLSYEEIEELKNNDQIKGEEYIERVASSNKSFSDKTVFSKEKYLKKKQQKHLSLFQILRPTSRTISEAYFSKTPSKIFFVRPDTLAQIINLANITSGDNVLIHETCSGLVIGSVAERLSGNGNIISLFTEQEAPVHNALKCFNFPNQEIENTYFPIHFHQFEPLVNIPLSSFNEPFSDDFIFKNCKSSSLDTKKKIRNIMEDYVDNLIIASKFNPQDVLLELFKYLRGSGNLVIFHPHLEAIVECHEMLHASNEAINIEIRETWFRDYQVLPLRTHPTMRMHGSSGYLLSAVKVVYTERNIKAPKNKKVKC